MPDFALLLSHIVDFIRYSFGTWEGFASQGITIVVIVLLVANIFLIVHLFRMVQEEN